MMIFSVLLSACLTIVGSPDKPESHNVLKTFAQDQKPVFSFGIITDVQYCDCDPAGTRYYRSSLVKLQEAVRSFLTDSLAFVINLGDLIERDFESYKPVMNILDSSGLKIYNLTGNHDYSVEPGMKEKIPVITGSKRAYYSFNIGSFRFIALNGNEVSTYSSTDKETIKKAGDLIKRLKADGEPNGIEWNGGIGPRQLKWLTEQISEASSKSEKVFILCHFPVWPENVHNLLNYREVISLLEKHNNIIAWFNGHNHSGNYGNLNKIHFVTLRGMVESESTGSYSIVEVYKNKIHIKGEGREKSQILAY